MRFSIIIPVAPWEDSCWDILCQFDFLTQDDEIIFVSPRDLNEEVNARRDQYNDKLNIRWIASPLGRATQMNVGANVAVGKYLWFLHCDSKIKKEAFLALELKIKAQLDALWFFDLKFLSPRPFFIFFNEWGAYIRSRVLLMPFGDQGFALRRDLYFIIGGLDENSLYGEDHLFIWQARQMGVKILPVKEKIFTSSRKYLKNGWANTTALHLFKTYKQALPEFILLLKIRVRKWISV